MIKIYCAYCKKHLRDKPFPRDDTRYGVCPKCVKKSFKNSEKVEIVDDD